MTAQRLLLPLAVLFCTAPGLAQERDAATADTLFREARALMAAHRFAEACPKLVESQRLDPAPGTAINLSDCYAGTGRLVEALQAARDALASLEPGDSRHEPITEQIKRLEGRVPKLLLRLPANAPTDLRVALDGTTLDQPQKGTALSVNPGTHSVVASATGRADRKLTVKLAESESKEILIEAGDPSNAIERPDRRPPGAGDGSLATVGYVVGGAGVLGLVWGTVSYLDFRSIENDRESICPTTVRCSSAEIAEDNRLREDADASGARAAISLGLGVIGVGAGATLLWL
ncbi:MAG TPA: hypothetical protein PKD61_33795, partial [Polyangiaceae bacterium]|nr:hypothetical protein [Polyangiaceae bacterium]